MSLAIRRVINQLRTKENKEYLTSTHFWGPFFNWAIPIAALADTQKDPKYISGNMTVALCLYSGIFMRFSIKVNPRNNLLLACHIVNATAQVIQLSRYINYNYSSKRSDTINNQLVTS